VNVAVAVAKITLRVGLGVGVGVLVAVAVSVGVGVPVRVGLGVNVGLLVAVGLPVALNIADGPVTVPLAPALPGTRQNALTVAALPPPQEAFSHAETRSVCDSSVHRTAPSSTETVDLPPSISSSIRTGTLLNVTDPPGSDKTYHVLRPSNSTRPVCTRIRMGDSGR
jgi:hypothetical protein